MSVRSLNGLAGSSTTNVYVNTIDVFTGTSPVVVAQANPNEQVNISLKDINGFGGAGKILEVNASNNGLVWGDQNWERVASAYLQPADITDIVSIPPDSYIRFDTNPISALGYELKHDQTNNDFVFRKKDGTQIYKYTPTGQFNAYSFEFGETDNERIVLSQNNLRINNRGNIAFREEAVNGTNQINLQAPAGLASSATITLPSSNGTLALVGQGGFITSVSSPLAVSSNNLTLGTVPISKGGTNLTSYTTGDIIYSSATDTLAKRGIGSTNQVLKVSGGIPVWDDETDTVYTGTGNIDITGTTISLTGTIPQSNGGTGFNTYTVGDLLYCSSSNTLSKLSIGSTDQVLKVSGGLPVWGTDTDTVYTVNTPITLTNSTEIGLTTVPYNLGGTGITSYTEGDLLYASADNVLAKLAHGSAGDILRMNGVGTLPEWRTMYGATSPIVLTGGTTFELTTVPYNLGGTGQTGYNQGDMLYASLTNNLTKINIGSTGQVLKVASGISIPIWADETDTTYTATSPLFVAGTNFTLSTVPIVKGGTNIVSYTEGDILYCSSSTGQGTLSKLPIGSTDQVLKVSGGVPVWGTDTDTVYTANTPITLTNSTEIGLTTVPYNLGGTGITTYTEGDLLYASADNVLAKLAHGNSGDILRMNGTGTLPEWRTMYSATSPIVLSGGLVFELNTVPVSKGGTGFTGCNVGDMIYSSTTNALTKLNIGSAGQILRVQNGSLIPFWDTETDTTYTGSGNIDITGTTISLTGTIPQSNGGTGFNTYTVGDILYCSSSNTLSKLAIGTTGQLLSVASGVPAWGTFTVGTKWSVGNSSLNNEEFLYPTTSTQRLAVGYTTNPDDRRLYVNGDMEADLIFCDDIRSQAGNNLVQQNASGYTMFGHDADDMYLKCDDHLYLRQNGNTLSVDIKNDGKTDATGSNRATDGIYNYLEYFCCNLSSHFSPSGSRTIGFTSYLGTQANSYRFLNFPTLATQFGNLYVSTDNDSQVSGDRTGGYYSAYFNSSGVNNVSDSRLKTDVETIPNPLEIINKLRGVYFKWNDGRSEERQTGFIAQEVNEVFTEVVDYDKDADVYAMRYDKITGLLTEGIKAVDKENTELKEKVSTLETELENYKSIVDKLINSKSFAEFKKSL